MARNYQRSKAKLFRSCWRTTLLYHQRQCGVKCPNRGTPGHQIHVVKVSFLLAQTPAQTKAGIIIIIVTGDQECSVNTAGVQQVSIRIWIKTAMQIVLWATVTEMHGNEQASSKPEEHSPSSTCCETILLSVYAMAPVQRLFSGRKPLPQRHLLKK